MPLQHSRGNAISASEGVYFPMANISMHRVTCLVTRTVLGALAGRVLSVDEFLETFRTYRRDIEAVASVVYDQKYINTPRTIAVGLKELDKIIAAKQLPEVQKNGEISVMSPGAQVRATPSMSAISAEDT
jgi:hypothetical protein